MLLLTRPDCPLCDEFLEELAHQFPRLAAAVRTADVDSREDWRQQYGTRIPVLLDEAGRVWGEGRLDPAAVAGRLESARRAGP
ncbi:MAG TPA: glutaredoxin family protein [Nevskia sp.]|nr:glutaredoxin family protein [Nevskia sp.]